MKNRHFLKKSGKGAFVRNVLPGFLVASALLVGCANSPSGIAPVERTSAVKLNKTEIEEVRKNLAGICKAIDRYGLIPDREIREHVRGRIEPLIRAAGRYSDTDRQIRQRARSTIRELISRYRHCEASLSAEIKAAQG